MHKIYCFETPSQISKKTTYSFSLPKYPESTTDPTYYEPQATRIANMRKSATAMKTLYDFEGDEAAKYSKPEFALNHISKAKIDPRFGNNLTREEISQVVNNLGDEVQDVVNEKKQKKQQKLKDIEDAITIKNVVESTTQKDNTDTE